MRIQSDDNQVFTNFQGEGVEFQLKASGKMFHMFINGIYQHKIAALIRELCANAYDSHIEAGVADKSFSVVLPNIHHPYFEVEDFGIGMSKETAFQLYPVLGESTKEFTNDLAGAFGIGSKTPFAYTSQFTVTCRKDGMEFVGIAYLMDDGTPKLDQISYSKTDKPNGLKVTVPVEEQDFHKFQVEASYWLSFYEVKPEVRKANFEFLYKNNKFKKNALTTVDLVYGQHAYSNKKYFAKMGPIVYPFDVSNCNIGDEKVKEITRFCSSVDCVMIFDFPIGSLNLNPSRESLSLTNSTIKTLSEVVQRQFDQEMQEYEKLINDCDDHPVAKHNHLYDLVANGEMSRSVANYFWKSLSSVYSNKYRRCIKAGLGTRFMYQKGTNSRKIQSCVNIMYDRFMPDHYGLGHERYVRNLKILQIEKPSINIVGKLITDCDHHFIVRGSIRKSEIERLEKILHRKIEIISYDVMYQEFLDEKRKNRVVNTNRTKHPTDTVMASGYTIRAAYGKLVVTPFTTERITLDDDCYYVESEDRLTLKVMGRMVDVVDFEDRIKSTIDQGKMNNSTIKVIRKNSSNEKRIEKNNVKSIDSFIAAKSLSEEDYFRKKIEPHLLRLEILYKIYTVDPDVFYKNEVDVFKFYDEYRKKNEIQNLNEQVVNGKPFIEYKCSKNVSNLKGRIDNLVTKSYWSNSDVYKRIEMKYPLAYVPTTKIYISDDEKRFEHTLVYIKALNEQFNMKRGVKNA